MTSLPRGTLPDSADVVVVGAGNAALSAALAARQNGARVLVLEKAPQTERGGNTAFTGGLFRFAFDGIDQMKPIIPDYTEGELAAVEVGSYTERSEERRVGKE